MIKPEQIPEEAVDGLRKAMFKNGTAREYIAAALNAWPGMWVLHQTDEDYIPPRHDLILPLPQEVRDE